MRIVLTEESHNHVDWETRSPVVWIEVGLLVGLLVMCLLVIPSPSPLRWPVLGTCAALILALGGLLAVTTPVVDRGHLERLPEGGDLKRTRMWLGGIERVTVDLPLEDIDRFEVESESFDDVPPAVVHQARLWGLTGDGARYCLTDWAEPDSVNALGLALEKAGRRELAQDAL